METSHANKTLKEIRNKEKSFQITSNKNNLFEVILINEEPHLLIKASFNSSIQIINFEEKFSLETIKKNPFFNYYESIDEILEELFSLIENKKVSLTEENKQISLVFELPIHKIKELKLSVKEKGKSDQEKIEELYDIVLNLKKENSLLKEENINIKKILENNEKMIKELIKRIEIDENKINTIEKENKKVLEEKAKDQKLKDIDSNILTNYENFELINKRLKNSEILKEKKINYKLLYRASRDGDEDKKFHEKCDNKRQILAVFKTTKGLIFGGYTEVGYKGNGNYIIDNKAFFFSCDLKKIYNVKTDKTAIYDHINYGPIFGNSNTIICVYDKMFDCNCCTCDINSNCFEGFNSDYEINNGESNFYLQEIEVFQILFK